MAAIGFLGFIVWAHHMYTVGLDVDTRAYLQRQPRLLLFLLVLKFLVDINNGWRINWNDNTYVICDSFVSLLTLGGVTGVIIAMLVLILLYMILICCWTFPLCSFYGSCIWIICWFLLLNRILTGLKYSDVLGKLHFWITLLV